jgi:hypothetical protein
MVFGWLCLWSSNEQDVWSLPSTAYSVTVCITGQAEGATISGTKNVTATVNTTGTNPIGGEHSRLTCDIAFDDCVGILRWRNAGIS